MEKLKIQGWILSEAGLKLVESCDSPQKILKTLLDRDLREVGAGVNDLHKGKFEGVEHELAVLQILKIRNISAPKANESSKTAPKLLKLQLTDGVNSYSAIEMDPIAALTIDTKPGTKIALKVKQMKMANGQLLFTPKNIEILGGHVEALVSKWELSRSLAGMKGSRTGATGGPPPFIPFGQKIQQNLPNDKSFKSLQQGKQKENENDDSEFKAQRQDAIAEATKVGTKKTFGGGSKILVDSNVQKVMDKGYTEEQAQTALKYSKNNAEKALSNLKRREDRQRVNSNEYEPREYSKEKRGGKGDRDEPQAAKPSNSVSLFDFLENKFPTPQESNAKQSSSSWANSDERFENNISSSFRKPDKDFTNKSQHWSHNSHEQKSSHSSYSAREYRDGGRDHRENREGGRDNRDGGRDFRGNGRDNREGGRYNREGGRDNRDSAHREYQRDGTREYRDNGRDQPRDYRNSRDSRDTRDYREGDSRRDSKYQQPSSNFSSKSIVTASNQYQKPPSAMSNGANSSYNSSTNASKGKYQKPDYNNAKPVPDFKKDYNNFPLPSSASGNNSNSFNKPRSNPSAPSKYYNEQHSNDYQKSSRNIVDSMEKMNLKGNHQQQYKGADTKLNASNYPPLVPSAEPSKPQSFPSKPGYPIVGFQNKEANEHAKNALKTKNIPGQQSQQQQHQQLPKPPSNWQKPQPPAPQHPPMAVAVIPTQPIKSQPPPPFPNAPAPPMHSLPQPFVQHQQVLHAMPATVNPPPAVYHQYPAPILMSSVQPPPGMGIPPPVSNSQQVKVGDLVLAKYWEDGQFYNAKITGVSESTYVVLFTDYGNAEELRKTDCVPLIPACPTPPHSANFAPAPPMNSSYRISTQKMPPPHHNYHQQTAPTSMPYKNVPGNSQRRN